CTSWRFRTVPGVTCFPGPSRCTPAPPDVTAVRRSEKSAKQKLREYLDERKPATVDERDWFELKRGLDVSDRYLRDLLEEAGVAVAAPYGGVRAHSREELERSLIELERVYQAGDQARRKYCRQVVIEAKDRARAASRNPRVDGEKRRLKAEMVEWMLVWLDSPEIFPVWAAARRARLLELDG
ncbi:MAG: hypothetical protein ACRD96_07995, partial [Bryobacteraceae bacterium]